MLVILFCDATNPYRCMLSFHTRLRAELFLKCDRRREIEILQPTLTENSRQMLVVMRRPTLGIEHPVKGLTVSNGSPEAAPILRAGGKHSIGNQEHLPGQFVSGHQEGMNRTLNPTEVGLLSVFGTSGQAPELADLIIFVRRQR